MILNEVTEAMKPGAKAVLDKRLDYHEATRTFQHALVQETLEQNNGVVRKAAMQLRVSNTWLHRLINGEADSRPSKRRGTDVVSPKTEAEPK